MTYKENYSSFFRALASPALFTAFINLNIDLGGRKLGNLTSKHTIANVCKNGCTWACNILSFYLLYVNGNAKMIVFVVKRFAVCKAKIGRYSVRKGGGGCHPHIRQVINIDNLRLIKSLMKIFMKK